MYQKDYTEDVTIYGIAVLLDTKTGLNNVDALFQLYTGHDDTFNLVESVRLKDTVFNNKFLKIPRYRYLYGGYHDCRDTAWYEQYLDTCTNIGDTLIKMYEVFFKCGHIISESCYAVGAFVELMQGVDTTQNLQIHALRRFPCNALLHFDQHGIPSVSQWEFFHGFFPITSRDIWLEHVTQHCGPVGTPMVVVSDDRTIACWLDSNDHSLYELAYGPADSPLDSLPTLSSQFKSVLITDLEPGTEYAFRVRGQCCYEDTIIVWSDWSDTIHFSLPQSGMGTAEGPLLQLTPNPAKETVLVSSDETILTLTIIDMSGRTVAELHPKETSATLDTHSLPSGTYLVRIATNHGITVKKLVVE